jgi:methyl-accepting chemotaxis protein
MNEQALKHIAREIQELRWTIIGEMEESQLRFYVKDVAKECSEIKNSLQEIAKTLQKIAEQ